MDTLPLLVTWCYHSDTCNRCYMLPEQQLHALLVTAVFIRYRYEYSNGVTYHSKGVTLVDTLPTCVFPFKKQTCSCKHVLAVMMDCKRCY